MVNELVRLLGIQKEIEKDFSKMKEFPTTLFLVGFTSLVVLIANSLLKFLRLNKGLDIALYTIIIIILITAIILNIKIKKDFKDTREKISQDFWETYRSIYNTSIETRMIEDVNFDANENKLSRKLDFKCVDQEINEKMISSFIREAVNSEKTEDELIEIYRKYPVENWDFYQIYGLKMAYISANKATLFMKYKLPNPDEQTQENINIISMYLNAIETLTKPDQKVYKKDLYERKVIDVDKRIGAPEMIASEIKPDKIYRPEIKKNEKISEISEQLENLDDEDIEKLIEQLNNRKKRK